MKAYNKFFIYHNIRLEIYSTIAIMPLGLYFVAIAGNYQGHKLYVLLYGSIIPYLITLFLGILARLYKLYPILKKLYSQNSHKNENIDFKIIKKTLINYPHFEAIIMSLRWIMGATLLNLNIYIMTNHYETNIYFLGVSFLAPTAYTLYFFVSENNLSKILFDKRLIREYLPIGSYIHTSIIIKTFMIIFSIAVILIIILGYILHQTSNNASFIENTSLHLIFISIQSTIVIFFFVYEATSNMKRSLKLQLENLEKIKNGHFDILQPMFSSDEINIAAQYLNILAGSLTEYSCKNKELTDSLEEKVKGRTLELSAAMEELEAMNDELLAARDQLWGEMQVAHRIQEILLPENPQIKNYEIESFMESAETVGGDYYDIINCNQRDWVMIGDVSGHGVSAGLIMMMVQTAIRAIVMDNPTIKPSSLLDKVDNAISHNIISMKEQKFVTISAFSVEDSGKILCSGRHEDILIYRSENKSVEVVPTDGICISPWSLGNKDKNIELILDPGDLLLLYTDGIIEARDLQDNFFGLEKLISIFQSNGQEPLKTIQQRILSSLENYLKNDDITIVLLKKLPNS